jgi:hypothetical protein
MKETNIKNFCCSQIIKYFRAAQKSLLLFCAAHRNKQKYFNTFALLWDDTKRSNCPGRADFAKARYLKSFSFFFSGPASSMLNGHLFWSQEMDNIFSTKMYHIELLDSP